MPDLATNVLYYGDSLDILRRYLPDAAVDLVYLDPPVNSKRDYNVIFRAESGNATDAQLAYPTCTSSSDKATWSAADASTTLHCGTAITVRPAAFAAATPDAESSRPIAVAGSTLSRRHTSR
jgi:hypothetical protein